MKKYILEIVDNCHGCPYCNYSVYYSMHEDSGYDCEHEEGQKRICNDSELYSYNKELEELAESKKTLFPREEELEDPLTIPEWCPLPDYIDED